LGIGLMRDPAQQLKAGAMFRRMLRKPLLRITGETAEVFGDLAAELALAGRGVEFRVQDLWLSAQAVQRGFGLLTFNGKDFQDVPRLKLIVIPPA
jgi:predicted nucleic acid-binding protein